eukprot:jgi/Bigna1/77496/fgenesh1_pg.48_\
MTNVFAEMKLTQNAMQFPDFMTRRRFSMKSRLYFVSRRINILYFLVVIKKRVYQHDTCSPLTIEVLPFQAACGASNPSRTATPEGMISASWIFVVLVGFAPWLSEGGILYELASYSSYTQSPITIPTIGNRYDQTIMYWMKVELNGRQNPFNGGYGGEGTMTVETSKSVSYYYGPNGDNNSGYIGFYTGSNSFNWNEWVHLALVRRLTTSPTLYWYVNGVLKSSRSAPFAVAGRTTFAKTVGSGYVNNLKGELKSFKIYNEALSQAQVQAMMNEANPSCPTVRETAPIFYTMNAAALSGDRTLGCTMTLAVSSQTGRYDSLALSGWNYWRTYHKGFLRNGQCSTPEATATVNGLIDGKKYSYRIYQWSDKGHSTYNTQNKLKANRAHEEDVTTTQTACEVPSASGEAVADSSGKIKFTFTRVAWHVALSGVYLEPVGKESEPGCPSSRQTHRFTFDFTSQGVVFSWVCSESSRKSGDGFNFGDKTLSQTTNYYHDPLSSQTWYGEQATMYGWTHTRNYHKGYLRNAAGTAVMTVKGLQVDKNYKWSIYQYCSSVPGTNRIRVNGGPWFDTYCDTDCAGLKPRATGIHPARNGELKFEFKKDVGHVSLHALGIDRADDFYCPSTRPVLLHLSRRVLLHERVVASSDISQRVPDERAYLGRVNCDNPDAQTEYALSLPCVQPWTMRGGRGEEDAERAFSKLLSPYAGSGKIVFQFYRLKHHVGVSQIGIDDYYGEFPRRMWPAAQLQWADDFYKLFNNPEDHPHLEAGTYRYDGDWYGMQNAANFPYESKDTFFSHEQWKAITEGPIPQDSTAAAVEVSVPKIQQWRLNEWNHVLKIQDKTGWKWAVSNGDEILFARHTWSAGAWARNAFSVNANNEGSSNYAILDQLEAMRLPSDKLWLKMCWPSSGEKCQIWYQKSNPYLTRTRTVVGYEPDAIAHTTKWWGGLYYDNDKALISGSALTSSAWYYALGTYGAWQTGGFPGPNGAVPVVELYALRPPTVDLSPIHHLCFDRCEHQLRDAFGAMEPFLKNGAVCTAGSGITLDGVDDYVELQNVNLGGNKPMTVVINFKLDSLVSNARVFEFGDSANNNNLILQLVGATATLRWQIFSGSSSRSHDVSSVFTANADTQVVVVTTKTGMTKVFKDGQLVGTKETSLKPIPGKKRAYHYLGKSMYSGVSTMKGSIASFSIYDRALVGPEILKLYQQSRIDKCFHFTNKAGNTEVFPYLSTVKGVTVKAVKEETDVCDIQIGAWLTGSASERLGSVAHDKDALWKYMAVTGKITKENTDFSKEARQHTRCKAPSSYNGGGLCANQLCVLNDSDVSFTPNDFLHRKASRSYRGVTYTYTSADCGGSTTFQSGHTCIAGLKEARQCGEDEDWRAQMTSPPKVSWWMNSACSGTNIASEYLCQHEGTRLTSDFQIHKCLSTKRYSGATKYQHTFTNAECGNSPPPFNGRDCLAVWNSRIMSGRDKQWEILPREQATTIKWQCPGCNANIRAEVHYLCPKLSHRSLSPWKIFRCYKFLACIVVFIGFRDGGVEEVFLESCLRDNQRSEAKITEFSPCVALFLAAAMASSTPQVIPGKPRTVKGTYRPRTPAASLLIVRDFSKGEMRICVSSIPPIQLDSAHGRHPVQMLVVSDDSYQWWCSARGAPRLTRGFVRRRMQLCFEIFQWWCGSCSGPSHIAADYLCLEEKSWVPTGIQGGGSFKLMGNIVNPYDPMWHGSNGRISNGYKALGSDYWVSINDWKGLIDAHPRRVDLIFKIFLNPSSNDFTLIYNDFKLDSSLRYYHAGGSCPQGSCPSGPQIQHNDPRTGWQGSWFDRGCCCYASGTSPFGWYGGCGHGQFGYVVGVNSYSTENRFAHTIDKNGNYVSPPVGSSKRSDGLLIRKEIWLHFT